MFARHAHQTRTLQRQVILKQIVRATLDTLETTAVVVMRVWLANTRLLRAMQCAQTASQGSIPWKLGPYPMYVRHAYQTHTLQRQVILKQIVLATLATRETTVVVAVRVWLANTRLLRVMHCALIVSQDSILWRLVPYQMYARHVHQTRTPQRQVVVRLIVLASLDTSEMTVVVAVRVWPAHTR